MNRAIHPCRRRCSLAERSSGTAPRNSASTVSSMSWAPTPRRSTCATNAAILDRYQMLRSAAGPMPQGVFVRHLVACILGVQPAGKFIRRMEPVDASAMRGRFRHPLEDGLGTNECLVPVCGEPGKTRQHHGVGLEPVPTSEWRRYRLWQALKP